MGFKTQGPIQGKVAQRATSAAVTLTADDSGKSFLLSGGGGTVTLPAVADAAGVRYKFITAGDVTTDFIVLAASAVIEGSVTIAGIVTLGVNESQVLVEATTVDSIGDWFELESDGTTWFLSGQAGVAGAFVLS
jgi:hypothetical protein